MINTLFWVITMPSIYIGGMCLTYKLMRKFFYQNPDDFELDDCRACSICWVITLPFLLVIVFPIKGIMKLFDMLDGD